MSDSETNVTRSDSSLDDWLAFNNDVFSLMKSGADLTGTDYAPFLDVDLQAGEARISSEEYFELVRNKVGSLGRLSLQLVDSEMDNSLHIIVVPNEEDV